MALTRIGQIAALMLLGSLAARGQGTVVFNNNIPGQVVAPIYGPEAGDATVRKSGNTPDGFPMGTQTYSGALLSGATWSAQLLGAPGLQPTTSLVAISPVTTFRTGSGAGFIAPITFVPSGIPAGTTQATVQMVVWDNAGGQFANWSLAEAAWNAGMIAAGKGVLCVVPQLEGQTTYLQSFNVAFVPEPGPVAFIGLGALCGLVRRRLAETGYSEHCH